MKKTLLAVTAIAVLGLAAAAFAHGPGPGYGGHMMGWGYGGHMSGPGHMGYGPGYSGSPADKEFLEKTADLRRDINDKRFEYSEALRLGDEKKAEKIAKELDTLLARLSEAAPRDYAKGNGNYCW